VNENTASINHDEKNNARNSSVAPSSRSSHLVDLPFPCFSFSQGDTSTPYLSTSRKEKLMRSSRRITTTTPPGAGLLTSHRPPCCSRRWLIVALLSAARFRHRTPSCNCRRSSRRPLSRPIVDSCPQAISSPAAVRLCCSRRWLVITLLSAARYRHRKPSCDC